jgi:hypothetical protein
MVRAFLLGVLVPLTPSLLAVAWLVWRADVPEAQEEEFSSSRRLQSDATKRPNSRSRAKRSPTKLA